MVSFTKLKNMLNTKKDIVKKIESIVLYILYAVYVMEVMYSSVHVISDILTLINKATKCLLALIVFKDIIELRKESIKKTVLTIVVLIIFAISGIVSDNKYGLYLVMFIIAFKNIEFDKFIKYDLILKSISIIFIVACYYLNFTEIYIAESATRGVRQGMGFSHPNVFAMYVVLTFFEYIYLKRENNNIKDVVKYVIVGIILFFIINYFTNSRTSLIMLALLLVFIVFNKVFSCIKIKDKLIDLFNKKNVLKKILKIITTNLFIILCLCSILMGYLYSKDYEIAYTIDDITSTRVRNIAKFMDEYDIHLFGNKLELLGSKQAGEAKVKSSILDNGYVRILLEWGLIVFILICIFSQKFLSYYIDKKEKILVVMMIIFLVGTLMETNFYELQYNVFLLCFSEIFYGSNKNNKELEEKENKS